MLRNDSLGSKVEETGSAANINSNEIEQENKELNYSKNNLTKSSYSIKNISDNDSNNTNDINDVDDINGIDNVNDINDDDSSINDDEKQYTLQEIKSYTSSKKSYVSNHNNKSNSSINAYVSKSQSSIKNVEDIFDNEIVRKINDQLKTSIDHHPDYLSKFLFTNKSVIGLYIYIYCR